MKEVTMNETLGEIVYEENVWTGKKSLTVNGETLEKTGKKTFRFADGRCTNVKGSMIFGTKMTVGNDTISISKPLTWYEYIIAIIIPAFVIIWGASPALVQIFPIVGGAVGGAIRGFAMVACILTMKQTAKPVLKILIGLGFFVVTLLICFLIASAMLSLL